MTRSEARHSRAAVTNREILRVIQAERRGTFYLSSVTGEVVAMRSELEVRYAACLDRLGYAWSYEPCGYEIEGERRYVPDFAVGLPGGEALIEVKRCMAPSTMRKVEAFRGCHSDVPLKVVGPRDIRALEELAAVSAAPLWLLIRVRRGLGSGAAGAMRVLGTDDLSEIQVHLHRAYLARRIQKEVCAWR